MRLFLRLTFLVLAIAWSLLGQQPWALGQEGRSLRFDHATTGFLLDSSHKGVACESCHTNGILRGTPRACASCHAGPGARAPGKSASHIPTGAACDSCHRPGASSWSEQAGGFVRPGGGHGIRPELGVTAGNCQNCHSGGHLSANALAKPPTHIQTTASCGSCHGTAAWLPASNPHAGVQAGSCASCHDGQKAIGKKIDHVLTAAACDTCHQGFAAFAPARMNHAGLDGQCAACHTGRYTTQGAQSKPAKHIPTPAGAQCDSCHHSTTSWATVSFDHANPALRPPGKPCADCHNGTTSGLGKPPSHVPTSAACDTCHVGFASFRPARMNHGGTQGQCLSCHNGAFQSVNAQGRSGRHIPSNQQCDTCHSGGFLNWSPARMNHSGLDSQCSSCHSGGYLAQNAQVKPATHIATSAQCDACHTSTTTWATAVFNHAAASPPVSGRCSSCHNGSPALGKPTNHIPTAAQCDSCHKTFAGFASVAMNHDGSAGKCASCHNGNFAFANARAKPAAHIPTAGQCDSCHTSGYKAWSPAVMNHAGLGGQCATCHGGAYVSQNAQQKPASHVSTTRQCDSCHQSTKSWATVSFAHDGSAAGRCDSCHGSRALGKPGNHLPTTAQCDSCHKNFASFQPAAMNHAAAAGVACASCHGGAYVAQNALAKPPTHIQTSLACDSCHGNGYQSWATVSFAHTAPVLQGKSCVDCHNGVSALGKPASHIPTGASCDSCHGTSFTAFKPARMNHATSAGVACASCHGGAYTGQGAQAKSAAHIPTSAACDSCHKDAAYAAWSPARMDHSGLSQCSTCHSGGYLPQNAQQKPASHIATSAECSSCHKSTSSWATQVFDHAAVPVRIGSGNCASNCHNGTAGRGLSKPATHIPTAAACDGCHNNFTAFAPAAMNHAGLAGQCQSCHGGAYTAVNARAKPASHVATTAQCDTCHASTGSWATVAYVHDATAWGRCATCHNGTTAVGLPGGHIPTAGQACSDCHKNFSSFKPAQMNHSATAGQCATCHNASYAAKNAQAMPSSHIRVSEQCDSCHKNGYLTWSPAAMDHSLASVKAQGCASCHSGAYLSQNAQQKPVSHVSTSQACDTCHRSTTSWSTAVNYVHPTTAVIGQGGCASCHNGSPALAKPAGHIPTNGQCDSCHATFTAFAPAAMNHAGTAGQCASCHGGAYRIVNAQAKPASHIATTQSCDTCHATTAWKPTAFAHQGVSAGSCANCHNGTNARAKNAGHIPTAAACDSCHNNYVAFAPARMNHAGLAGQCATCHAGAYLAVNAQVKPATHVATTAQCDTCHGSTTSWATVSYVHPASAAGSCDSCHGKNALGKPTNHIPTTAQCDSCHGNFTAFKPARMNHAGSAGKCSWCHSGNYSFANAQAKPAAHIPVSEQCDTCHRNGFVAWSPSVMDHSLASVKAQGCSTCHGGAYLAQNAQSKPVTHVATSAQCSTCHQSTTSWSTNVSYRHAANVTIGGGGCATCHNGTTALGKSTNHLPTSAQCDSCHQNFTAFAPARMNHAGTAGACANCHGGAYTTLGARPKPATHIPSNLSCDSCHTTAAWKPTSFAHNGVTAGSCVTCHNGSNALGKSAAHIPTSAACDSCHKNYVAFAPAQMNHSGLAGQCASCHGGAYVAVNAQSKPVSHVSTTAQCDVCHASTTSWATASFVHANPPGVCANCHNGTTALGKPMTHIPTSAACDSCHKNQQSFKPATMNHAGLAGQCSTCHGGAYVAFNAQAKPSTHIPVTAQCDTCHTRGFTAWSPAAMVHGPATVGQCSTCHGGAYLGQNAQSKPATHTPTSAQCDSCHKSTTSWSTNLNYTHAPSISIGNGGCSTCHGVSALGKSTNHVPTSAQCDSCHKNFTAFAPAAMNHAGTGGSCATCHNGSYTALNAQAKPASHLATSQSCDVCHGTSAWKPATFSHAGVAAASCAGCHNGSAALGKPASHIPTSAACDSCHKNYVAFAPAQMNHAGSAGKCSSCHGGAYVAVNAQAKPASHVATGAQCDSCHASTTTWSNPNFTHPASAAGTCSNCHNGTVRGALAKPATHIPTTAQCDSCHQNYTAFAPARMNHAGSAGNCTSCHGGSYVAQHALAKPATHVPTTAQCDSCHKNFAAFAPASMNHVGSAGQCANCHNGAYTAQDARAKPATHIQTTQSCDACHTTTAWLPTSFAHTATQLAGKTCVNCHNGTTASGKPALHIPTGQSCEVCHRTGIAWLPTITPYAHAGVAAASCASCHAANYPGMDFKPASHLPTTAACDACHNRNAWTPVASFTHAGVGAGTCATCHDTRFVGVVAKPANHIPTTLSGLPGNECSNCHTSTASFGAVRMNHGAAAPSGLVCKTCHLSGTSFLGGMEKKSLTHESRNTKATDCSAAGCHKPLGSKGKLFTEWD